MPNLVRSYRLVVRGKKKDIFTTNYQLQTTSQLGFSQIILPLFLIAAIGLSVFLVQQRTNLIPFAQQNDQPPQGCHRVTTSTDNREVRWKDKNGNVDGEYRKSPFETENSTCGGANCFKDKWQYPFKEVRWTWTGGWKDTTRKIWAGVENENASPPNGQTVGWDRVNYGPAPTRWESPDGKSYHSRASNAPITGAANAGLLREELRADDGKGSVVVFSKFVDGFNHQGVANQKTFEPNGSYAFVPDNPNAGTDCAGGGGGGGDGAGRGNGNNTGTKGEGEACTDGPECRSGTCSNRKCSGSGSKAGGAACTDGAECQSGTCTNRKCEGGTRTSGQACDENKDCASNRCGADRRCAATTSNTTTNRTANTTNTTNRTTGTTTTPTTTTPVTTTPAASTPAASAPSASAPGSSTPTPLTKAEITSFKTSYDKLAARLGTASNSGNLKVVATIAGNELSSIVSQLPSCPDDANVGTCLDSKFRTRFDLAKTAARLSAFYAIFNNVSGVCVKADLGLNPLITATSQSNTQGRVNLCTEPTASNKVWKVFAGGKFVDLLSTDTRFPANPTCTTLPTTEPINVLEHYRRAEGLFTNQPGFVANTKCDGKTP